MEFTEPACEACEASCEKYAPCNERSVMRARILRVSCCELLVCDLCTSQEVLVHTDKACCFCVGQCVCIEYSGAMTMSIPPQIHADCIRLPNTGGCRC